MTTATETRQRTRREIDYDSLTPENFAEKVRVGDLIIHDGKRELVDLVSEGSHHIWTLRREENGDIFAFDIYFNGNVIRNQYLHYRKDFKQHYANPNRALKLAGL